MATTFPDPVGQPEKDALVPRAHPEHAGAVVQQAEVLEAHGQLGELPHLALDVGDRVALGQEAAQHREQARIAEVGEVAGLGVTACEVCHE
ncbi:MAG: hypothetical protein M3350_03600 [Actinomycetota bacterium]|nr:hypothetical protein [Actinomycetota bacterium]